MFHQTPDRVWAGILMGVDRHLNVILHHAQEIRVEHSGISSS